MNALHKRIITALGLLPLVLALIFYSTPQIFALATAFVVLIGASEWAKIINLSNIMQILYLLAFGAVLFFSKYIPDNYVLFASAAFWLLAFIPVIKFRGEKPKWANCKHVLSLLGFVVIYPTWVAMNIIHNLNYGPWVLLSLLLIIWSVDTGAFFAGRKFGKHKLMPKVSPGKTWEGVLGGVLLGSLVTIGIYFCFNSLELNQKVPEILQNILVLFSTSIVVMLISVLGDLFESLIKRIHGVKDSGNILPGHGGILDRIDSLTAAFPIFALVIILLKG